MENLLNYTAALKEYWAPGVCKTVYLKDNPFLAMVKKDPKWVGKDAIRIPIVWGPGGSTSSNFSEAQTGATDNFTGINEFKISRHKTHGIGIIDNELLRATKNDMGAFTQASRANIEGVIGRLGRELEICAFRQGYGDRGRIDASTTIASDTVKLTVPSDAYNFQKGDRFDVTAAVGNTAAARARGSSTKPLIVLGADYDAGTVKFSSVLNNATTGIPTIAVGDYLVTAGDVGTNSATSYRSKPCGLLGWSPDVAPSSGENFYGMDRSVASLLYGSRIDTSATGTFPGLPIVEAINKGVGKMLALGGRCSHVWTSFSTFEDIVNSIGSKVQYVDNEVLPGIGFRGIRLETPRGTATVYSSTGCDDNHVFLTDMSGITLYSLDEAITVSDEDGFEMVRCYNQDACEVRYKTMANYGCPNPAGSICTIRLR